MTKPLKPSRCALFLRPSGLFHSQRHEKPSKIPGAVTYRGTIRQKEFTGKEDDTTMAYSMMQEFVKKNLVAPGSAKFHWFSEPDCKVSKDGFDYTISSWVDSLNQFGAIIRTRFSGVIRQIEKSNWKLRSLDFEE
jgi:hypothetical protein